MIYTLKQKSIDNFILLMLTMSTGGLLFVYNRNVVSIAFLILLIVVILFLENTIKKSIFNSALLTFTAFITLGLINYNFAAVDQTSNKYLFHLLTVVLSILSLLHFKNNRTNYQLIRSLYIVLRLIVFHSFFSFIAYLFLKDDLIIITSEYHECKTFMNIFFYSIDGAKSSIFGLEFCRNQGLFWEPGILQIFLNMFFFLEAFIIKKRKSLLILTALVILTTYSTTGLLLLLIQFTVYLFNEFKLNKWIRPFVLLLAIPVYTIFSVNIDEKIYGEGESSFQKRYFDLVQPFFIALENPLTGIGLDLFEFQKIRQEFYIPPSSVQSIDSLTGIDSKVQVSDRGSTNSIMFLLAGAGFPSAILLMVMFFKQQIIAEKKWLWMLIMIVSVMSEPLLLRPFFFLFIVSGFNQMFYNITSRKKLIS
tara:strand:- start:587 stop:1849 length:1263 start_codon:yes stop_codon:yes gene_type:complete